MTFGDFTESELENRNLAKRVNDIKTQFKDLHVPKHHKRTSSEEGNELEILSYNLSNSQVSAFKSSMLPLRPPT